MSTPEFTLEQAQRVLTIVDAGLIKGLGVPEPGKLCVEAAICLALGLPHGDDPGCVEPAVRAFKIRLNDSPWSSNDARAKGLRALAVAQLGSKGTVDGREFVRRLAEQTIRQIVPPALRAAASRNPKQAARLEAAAVRCEQEGTRAAALEGKNAAAAADAAAAAERVVLRARALTKIAEIALSILRDLHAPGVALWEAVNDSATAR